MLNAADEMPLLGRSHRVSLPESLQTPSPLDRVDEDEDDHPGLINVEVDLETLFMPVSSPSSWCRNGDAEVIPGALSRLCIGSRGYLVLCLGVPDTQPPGR